MIKLHHGRHQTVAEIAMKFGPFLFVSACPWKTNGRRAQRGGHSIPDQNMGGKLGGKIGDKQGDKPGRRRLHPKPDRRQAGRQDKTGDKLGLEASQEGGQSAQTKTKNFKKKERTNQGPPPHMKGANTTPEPKRADTLTNTHPQMKGVKTTPKPKVDASKVALRTPTANCFGNEKGKKI